MDEVEELVDEIATIKEEIAALEERRRKRQNELVQELRARDETAAESVSFKATLVEPERTVIDEVALADDLSPEQWESISRRVMDKAKLEAAVANGEVDMDIVVAHTEFVPTTPYIKITKKRLQK